MPVAINTNIQSLLLDVADRSTFSQYEVRAGLLHIASQICLFLLRLCECRLVEQSHHILTVFVILIFEKRNYVLEG